MNEINIITKTKNNPVIKFGSIEDDITSLSHEDILQDLCSKNDLDINEIKIQHIYVNKRNNKKWILLRSNKANY